MLFTSRQPAGGYIEKVKIVGMCGKVEKESQALPQKS